MLTTAEALEAVLAAITTSPPESISTADATGRVLRQTVKAERSQPPFDRVMMDGIALAWSDYEGGQREFPIQAMQAAGDEALVLEAKQEGNRLTPPASAIEQTAAIAKKRGIPLASLLPR